MCYKNDWSIVCDDVWDTNDSQVVCTQLGYSVLEQRSVSLTVMLISVAVMTVIILMMLE